MKKQYVDGVLVEWGTALFNQGRVAAPPPRRSMTGFKLPARGASRPVAKGGAVAAGAAVTADANAIRSKLGSIVRRTPQVVVKISGGGKGVKHIKAHLDYITRNGKLEAENQAGEVIEGRQGLSDLRDEWQYGGLVLEDEGTRREAFNIVLGMPDGTDPLAVKRAARDFAALEFEGYQYVMVLHTFDTDPDPKPSHNPHVHLCVKAESIEGVRLNPRKADLQRWRDGFAEALRENGVEAAATKRIQRLERWEGDRIPKLSVRRMKGRGEELDGRNGGTSREALARFAKAKSAEATVKQRYRNMVEALQASDDAEDRALAKGLAERLGDKLREDERQKPKGRDVSGGLDR